MNQTITGYGPDEWHEAQQRAETYLRALHGRFGPAERSYSCMRYKPLREREENVGLIPSPW